MTIAFVVLPERGALYPTFSLARKLKAWGHRVIYYTLTDFEDDVRRQGIECRTMLEDVFGKGRADEDPIADDEGTLGLLRRARRQWLPWYQRGVPEIVSGRVGADLRADGVRVVVLDPLLTELFAPVAIHEGFKAVSLATELVGVGNLSIPPSRCDYVLREDSWRSRMYSRMQWARMALLNARERAARELLGLRPPRAAREEQRRIYRNAGLSSIFYEKGFRFQLPEMVLCPSEFDFPAARPHRRYGGSTIDFSRVEVDFPWERLANERRPIVYVSLGTHAALYKGKTRPFLRKVFELARVRRDLCFVISTGKGRDVEEIGAVPEGVIALPIVPQLKILERAAVMITNGGLGTLKECIHFQVPTVVVPCAFDQPGNAARVEFHGIGVRADVQRVSAGELSLALDTCMSSTHIRSSLAKMAASIRQSTEPEQLLEWLSALDEVDSRDQAAVA